MRKLTSPVPIVFALSNQMNVSSIIQMQMPKKLFAMLFSFWVLSVDSSHAIAQNGVSGTGAATWSDRALDGVLQPYHDIEVATVETGIIDKILVRPGDFVKAGQPLAVLRSESVEAQLRMKEIEVARTGKIKQARAEYALQKTKFDKVTKLFTEGKISHSELERSQADLIVSQGRLESEEDNAVVLEADLDRYRKMLADRTIIAPIDGIVTDVQKQIGEFVAASAPVMLRLVDVSKLRATFSVQESELSSISRGGAMRVQLSNGQSVEGLVEYVPPVADPETGWFMISVVIENTDTKIVGSRCQRLP
jgi:RND family efflux transporter MFP subunit